MAALHDIHHGKVFTHLIELLNGVEADLGYANVDRNNGKTKLLLTEITARLDSDPVYMEISAGTFISPVRQSPHSKLLQTKVESVERLITNSAVAMKGLSPFLDTVKKFLNSAGGEWRRSSGYFIVPVVDSKNQAGMVYLRSPRKQRLSSESRRKLATEDLTQDSKVDSYFHVLASVMLKRFYYLKHFPLDIYTGISDFSYPLHFGNQITEGRSVGAALFAMYLLNYLESALGDVAYTNFVAPQVGTLLTGEIDPQGLVKEVDDLEQKVRCAIDEYGPELKLILPKSEQGEQLPPSVANLVNAGNIHYVRSVEEMMSKVLSTAGDVRGLDKARAAVFGGLLQTEIAELSRNLLPDVPPDIYIRRRRWREPVPHEQNMNSLTSAWNDRLDIAFGTDAFSLTSDGTTNMQGKKLIQVILDGSVAMDGYWAAVEAQNEVSRMAIALYEIARRIDPNREDLVFGFLGYSHFEQYDHQQYTTAKLLEPILKDRRTRFGLRKRGPFLRPVRELSRDLYGGRQKRIYILSESNIPDMYDLKDARVESFELLRLVSREREFVNGASLTGRNQILRQASGLQAIFSEESITNQELLSRYFHKRAATLPEVEIDIGTDLPITWEPAEATVSRQNGRYVIKCQNDEALQWKLRIRLANHYPYQVSVSGTIKHDAHSLNYSFTAFPDVTELPPLPLWVEGELTDPEMKLWQNICASTGSCPHPKCRHKETVHIAHPSEHGITPELIFPSLTKLGRGWLLLGHAQPRWLLFKTGCQIANLSIVIVDGRPHYSAAEGYLEPVPDAPIGEGLYCLKQVWGTFYLSYI
jgi:hypothetical protein